MEESQVSLLISVSFEAGGEPAGQAPHVVVSGDGLPLLRVVPRIDGDRGRLPAGGLAVAAGKPFEPAGEAPEPTNVASRRVMEKVGFVYERDVEHHGRQQVLYRKAPLAVPSSG